MKGLNLSGWQKVGGDKKSTTLKHDKGHVMIVAHGKLPKIQQEALKRLKMADGGTVPPQTPVQSAQDSMRKAFHFDDGGKVPPPVTVNVGQPAMGQPNQSDQPTPVEVPQVPQNQNVLLPNGSMNAPASAQTAQQGAKLGADVQAAKSAAEVPQQQELLNRQTQLNQDETNNINDLKQKADDFNQWHGQNPLKENAYLENMSTGKKMSTALGLLFSGAGSGLSGQPNMAYDFLNKQIDRNVQAQKDRFGQQSTVWGAYKDLYGNEQVANNMARVHALDALQTKAKITAAQLGTPAAAAALMDLQSKIAPERNKLILDSAGNLKSTPNLPSKEIPDQGSNSPSRQKMIDQGFIAGGNYQPNEAGMGMQESSASIQPKHLESDKYADTGVLLPGAQEKLDELRYTPKAKDEINQIKEQYTAAQQADALLSQLHGVHQAMYKQAIEGGSPGYLRRHDPTEAVPFIGPAISNMLVKPATATLNNKEYDSNRTRIVGDIANALKGSNVGVEEIHRMVNDNVPEPHDSPELIEKKERNIRLFIKNNVNKSLLKDWKLSH